MKADKAMGMLLDDACPTTDPADDQGWAWYKFEMHCSHMFVRAKKEPKRNVWKISGVRRNI